MTLSGIVLLLRSRKRTLAVLGVVAALLGGTVAAGLLGTPSVTGVDNRFGDVNESTTVIESDLRVSNPNPIGVKLGGTTVDYAVRMNGVPMANGTKSGVEVEKGDSTIPLTTRMSNDRIPAWWASHVRRGERTTLAVDADVHSSLVGTTFGAPAVERPVETDILGGFNSTETRPLNADREPLVDDPVLYVNETSATWGTVTDERTTLETRFVVYNPKSYPVTVSKIGYDIQMNDVAMGEGATDHGYTIPGESTETIRATTTLRNDRLDEWWVSHLERDQVTDLSVQFYLAFDLTRLGGGTVRVPLDEMNQTIETDIFGTKNESDDGAAGGAPTPTDDADSTPTTERPGSPPETTAEPTEESGTTTTATETAERTATATADPTTTDDGLVGVASRDAQIRSRSRLALNPA